MIWFYQNRPLRKPCIIQGGFVSSANSSEEEIQEQVEEVLQESVSFAIPNSRIGDTLKRGYRVVSARE